MAGKRGDYLSRYLRQIFILGTLAIVWELLARLGIWPQLLFPTVTDILSALVEELASGEIASRTWYSLSLIATGLGLAIITSFLASSLAML